MSKQASDTTSIRQIRAKADKVMVGTLAFLQVVCLGIAAANGSWLPALAVGLPALAVPVLIARMLPGSTAASCAVAAGFMIFCAVMIQQTGGMIESHFGIFVLIAFLLLYADWRPWWLPRASSRCITSDSICCRQTASAYSCSR